MFLADFFTLVNADFVVCTHSSNICRLVYEYMHALKSDAYIRVRPIDIEYYFFGYNTMYRIAVVDHIPASNSSEIELKTGDILKLVVYKAYDAQDGNLFNGYSRGLNMRTNKIGIVPSFKIKHYPYKV